MPVEAWKAMAQHMGVENMGGPSVGFLPELPTPTVTYGAVMQHDERTGAMTGFAYGSATGGPHAGHAAAAAHAAARDTSHTMHGGGAAGMGMTHDSAHMAGMMELHMRMMADPVIRERMMADTAMRRMMSAMMDRMPAEHREHMGAMMQRDSGTVSRPAPRRAAPTRTARPATRPAAKATPKPAAKPAAKPVPAKPADPHAGHGTPSRPPAPDAGSHGGHGS